MESDDWQAAEMARLDETFSAQLDSIKQAQDNAQISLNREMGE